ncbi:glutamine amidotransferase [Massilia sp. Root351]|jgi:putative intracellular protease/amidase|uniref:type 1 glutamine amidotransferase family protein n=1 Tax=Massilia sp. Root351 TaxID=1736522 RepID=UPI00070DB65F|nr:type 1 glutamine amidotransferase family protein [Massilia sp. Root351]KQV80874.1 glutamine amidotransferase [Massilia sp. Root351]
MKIYLVVLNTLADWEIGYLTAELHSKRMMAAPGVACEIVKVGLTPAPIATMGGISITPDITFDAVRMEADDLLLMPGADSWQEPPTAPLLAFAKDMVVRGHRVAAICGATIGLAQAGALDDRQHTSNDKGYLKTVCPGYTGEQRYVDSPAVRDGNLITASGLAPLEFSYEVMKMLGLFRPATVDAWFKLYSTREPQYYEALMASMG